MLKTIYQAVFSEKTRIQLKVLYRKAISYKYKGDKVTCNCCNKSFTHFLPYGDVEKRNNAACPWCYSLERTRMLWHFLNNSTYLKNQSKVLHFAPFKIVENKLKENPSIDYLSADINPNLAMDKADITNLKYNDNSFDLIICSHVLSVIKNETKAISEMYRVLKDGGRLLFLGRVFEGLDTTFEDSSLVTETERFQAYGKPYVYRMYGKDTHIRFEKAGFKVEIYNHLETFAKDEITKFGLQGSGNIYICSKVV